MRKLALILLLLGVTTAFSQKPHQPSSAEIYQDIKKLNVLGNVLYLAAHPDDENTRFIAWCANEKLYNTAYLSLTRGDGGQNLIGPEIREALGIIRTQELLAARRVDGGQQFFSRANDFGYSKTSRETQEIWDRDKILSDIVWVIRKFRPDVIVCRFPPDSRGGHGHHTASAELGIEAFNMAADPKAYPDQLKYVETWQPKRIVTNTGRWWRKDISADEEGVVSHDIGTYNELLGTSYNELAAVSRSQHKSQGFGSTGRRGELEEFFEHLSGKEAQKSLFEGYSTDWDRVKGSEKIAALAGKVEADFDLNQPAASIPALLELRKALQELPDKSWKEIKTKEVDELIRNCAGLYLEAAANDHSASQGDSVKVAFELINRSGAKITVTGISSQQLPANLSPNQALEDNKKINLDDAYKIPTKLPYSQPYWLEKKGTLGTYNVSDQLLIGKGENDAAIRFKVDLTIDGQAMSYEIPLIYKWNDPVKGELYRPFVITPPVFVNFNEPSQIFSNLDAREIEFTVKSGREGFKGQLTLKAPIGWFLSKTSWDLDLPRKGGEARLKVIVQPRKDAKNGDLLAFVNHDGKTHNYSLETISYDHIPIQTYFPQSSSQLVYIDLKKRGELVGYIEGAGDVIPESLENIGYQVDKLSEADITSENLKKYNTIILGIRALNTNDRIGFIMPTLLEYTKNGGTLIIQYNTAHRLKTKDFAPYPIELSRNRVTEEDAEVTFLLPDHPVLNSPNKIQKEDFDFWVQERGLYFPGKWDDKYQAVLSWHDRDEEAKDGSLLVAEYGEGHFVYTGISFFRELPAGVPGAYRLLTNLISLGNE